MKNVLNKRKSWCATATFFFPRLLFSVLFFPVLGPDHAWCCWCNSVLVYFFGDAVENVLLYIYIFFSRSESNGSKIEKNSFRCFYRCLLRTFWACSCVLFKCPHGTRVRYMRKHYCLTQSRSSGRASYEAIMMAVCLGSRVDAEAFTLILIYYCRRGGIDMPTMPHIYMYIAYRWACESSIHILHARLCSHRTLHMVDFSI